MKYAVSIIILIYSVLIYYTMTINPYKIDHLVNTTIFTLIIPILVCYLIRHIVMWFYLMKWQYK
ncbi:hypothetical protein EVC27_013 [Rhizobium phage RHph_I1_6]|uniref:Uncharacterized protein n=1 Tax=Rhizobium phage RHph_I1_6 TaxID=2509728 RepID=A0A7S5V294_9CAUD|nr:hypothetical protein PP745_gp013 [Rhizobium phage RHph_I1_6]QIG76538.1 hypothetical protein EVC27_013 [Rhizobium phage RHph_I1_6]